MIKKLLIVALVVFACGTLHAQEYDPYKEYRYDYGGSRTNGGSDDPNYDPNAGGEPTPPSPPGEQGSLTDVNPGPIGDGIVLLIGLGAAYALRNRKKNE